MQPVVPAVARVTGEADMIQSGAQSGHSGEGAGETNWESNTETYILPYVKQIASGNLLYDAENSNPVLCDNLEGWDGMGGRREVQEEGDICILMAGSCWCMAETNTTL